MKAHVLSKKSSKKNKAFIAVELEQKRFLCKPVKKIKPQDEPQTIAEIDG